MKKTYLFILIVLLSTIGYCQSSSHPVIFEYSGSGINDYVVIRTTGSTSELYNKTVDWIKETYENPDKVIIMKIKNKKVRIRGVANNILTIRGIGTSLHYIVEISFKDDRYKFELSSLTTDTGTDYKMIPDFKTNKKLVKIFSSTPKNIETYFNNLNDSLKKYILGNIDNESW